MHRAEPDRAAGVAMPDLTATRAADRYRGGGQSKEDELGVRSVAKTFAPAAVVPHNPERARTFRQNPEGFNPSWHRRILKPDHVCNVGRSNGGTRRRHSTNQEKSDDEQKREARKKKTRAFA